MVRVVVLVSVSGGVAVRMCMCVCGCVLRDTKRGHVNGLSREVLEPERLTQT